MKKQSEKSSPDKKKGPTIPAGTEQETGLTRGRTEKPNAPLPGKPDPSSPSKNIKREK
jgi:hypothetical protein